MRSKQSKKSTYKMIDRMVNDIFFTILSKIEPTPLCNEVTIFKRGWTFN